MSYVPPKYPHDRLAPFKEVANSFEGGAIDLSVGTPNDVPPELVMQALNNVSLTKSYQPSIGILGLREAASRWLERRLGVIVDPAHIAATIGTKEFVVSTPSYLALRYPDKDVVLYPAISYPSYAMGAELAGLESYAVPVDSLGRLKLGEVPADIASRALCLWSNSPSNPAGGVDDLGAIARWCREHETIALSDECYVEFIWDDHISSTTSATPGSSSPGGARGAGVDRTILSYGSEGVLALHSLSKRSNFAGGRLGFYAGDPELVHYLSEVRKHAGMMVPGPIQSAAIVALDDDEHVELQRNRYYERLVFMREILTEMGYRVELPQGGFYLWADVGDRDVWDVAAELAHSAGVLCSPGDFYGSEASSFIRFALVEPVERLELIRRRRASS